jgi:hypothetical protein
MGKFENLKMEILHSDSQISVVGFTLGKQAKHSA